MNNFNYKKKYHYLIKYIIIAMPILILILSSIRGISINYLSSFFNDLLSLDINNWYISIIELLGFNDLANGDINLILLGYPLYILWLYAFDLLIDIFGFIINLAHNLLYKLGGGINE